MSRSPDDHKKKHDDHGADGQQVCLWVMLSINATYCACKSLQRLRLFYAATFSRSLLLNNAGETPKVTAILRIDSPCCIRSRTACKSNAWRFLPGRWPFVLACRKPALMRSTVTLRSISATPASIVNTSLPTAVDVSTPSVSETNSMPRLRNVCKLLRRWDVDHAKRSNFQTMTASNFF